MGFFSSLPGGPSLKNLWVWHLSKSSLSQRRRIHPLKHSICQSHREKKRPRQRSLHWLHYISFHVLLINYTSIKRSTVARGAARQGGKPPWYQQFRMGGFSAGACWTPPEECVPPQLNYALSVWQQLIFLFHRRTQSMFWLSPRCWKSNHPVVSLRLDGGNGETLIWPLRPLAGMHQRLISHVWVACATQTHA